MRTFYIDYHPDDPASIEAGQIVETTKARYEVKDAWPTESKVWPNRWTVKLERLHSTIPTDVLIAGRPRDQVITLSSYPPGTGPHEFFDWKWPPGSI